MQNFDDRERPERSWYIPLWILKRDSSGHRWVGRPRRDVPIVLANERDTRRFLAKEVYGVPDPLLDDVIRVRLADLT